MLDQKPEKTPVRICFWWLTFVVVGCLLLLHYSILFIYCMPVNPIQYTFQSQINAYTRTFFTQDWRFFAPNPATTDNILSARATVAHDAHTGQYTAWVDLITPLISALQANRFTEQQIPELMVSNATLDMVNNGGLDPNSSYSQAIARGDYSAEYIILARYACHVLNELYPQNHFTFVQLAITQKQPPDFLHAASNDYQITGNNIFPPLKYLVVT